MLLTATSARVAPTATRSINLQNQTRGTDKPSPFLYSVQANSSTSTLVTFLRHFSELRISFNPEVSKESQRRTSQPSQVLDGQHGFLSRPFTSQDGTASRRIVKIRSEFEYPTSSLPRLNLSIGRKPKLRFSRERKLKFLLSPPPIPPRPNLKAKDTKKKVDVNNGKKTIHPKSLSYASVTGSNVFSTLKKISQIYQPRKPRKYTGQLTTPTGENLNST